VRESIAIIGANLAGGRAAQALRSEGFDGHIILIGAEPYPPYERPPLSKQVLLREYQPERAYLMPQSGWDELNVSLRLSTTVTAIDPAAHEVQLSDGNRIRAGKILLCTGGHVRRLQVPGANLDGVHYLRTMDDAISVRDRLTPDLPVVVVGGGFIGAEVAASARMAGCDVAMLEVEDVPLWRVLGRELGGRLTRFHRDRGVRVATRTTVERIEGNRSVTHVVTTNNERLNAELVVVGVGIVPAVELAEAAHVEVSNGIVVNEFCETSAPNVWAAGDVANHPNSIIGQRVRLEHWQNAQNQAVAAAKSMLGRGVPFREVPWFWSDQYDLNIQMSGHPHPDDTLVYRGDADSTSFSAFFLRNGVLRAALGVNRPGDVRATMKYIETGPNLDPHVLADETTDLRNLSPFRRE
jgi:3-phenylpropionate/trans-cinnamate dioxygenase ferredoxin reductase subunit